MNDDLYQIGTEHRIGSHSYIVTPQSTADVVWLRLVGTDVEMPVSRALMVDALVNLGPILDRQIAEYQAGRYLANPIDAMGITTDEQKQ